MPRSWRNIVRLLQLAGGRHGALGFLWPSRFLQSWWQGRGNLCLPAFKSDTVIQDSYRPTRYHWKLKRSRFFHVVSVSHQAFLVWEKHLLLDRKASKILELQRSSTEEQLGFMPIQPTLIECARGFSSQCLTMHAQVSAFGNFEMLCRLPWWQLLVPLPSTTSNSRALQLVAEIS